MEPTFLTVAPSPPLDGLVELLWYADGPTASGLEWVLPAGRPQLLVQLREGSNRWRDGAGAHDSGDLAVSGPFDHPICIDRSDQRGVLGAVFRPGGLAAFTGVPAAALRNTHVALHDLWPADRWGRWRDAMRAAPTPQRALRLLERGLLTRCDPVQPLPIAVACRRMGHPGARVETVAAGLGMSRRRLSRWFSDAVGLGPKRYAGLQRFQRALSMLHGGNFVDLAEVAFATGYYDQAHFNHAFRRHSGMRPTDYLGGERPYSTHVAMRDD